MGLLNVIPFDENDIKDIKNMSSKEKTNENRPLLGTFFDSHVKYNNKQKNRIRNKWNCVN